MCVLLCVVLGSTAMFWQSEDVPTVILHGSVFVSVSSHIEAPMLHHVNHTSNHRKLIMFNDMLMINRSTS